MGVHFIYTVLKLNTAFQSTKFKMKVLAVCLMAAALVGMGASTSLQKVGETGASTSLEEVNSETTLNVVEVEEHGSMDFEVLREGPGAEGNCRYAGKVADANICAYTCKRYFYPYYAYCHGSHRCECAKHRGRCPC